MNAAIAVSGVVRAPLTGVDLAVTPGEIVALLGANGAGKSTLLLAIAGLRRFTGTIAVAGAPAGSRAARAALGFASERPAFPDDAGAHALGRMLAALSGVSSAEADRALAALGVPDVGVAALSTGGLTRLAVAAAIAGTPQVLLLDEPLTGLDRDGVDRVVAALSAAASRGAAVVVATHRLGPLATVATRVVRLEAGRLRELGPPAVALGGRARLLVAHGASLEERTSEDSNADIARIHATGGRVLRVEPELGEGG